jgi:hypothetical protein
MANKYCNIQGNTKIKDTYTDINVGFDKVETDVSNINNTTNLEITNRQNADAAINERIDNIINNPDGNKDAEIVDARNSYSTLKERLDTERQTAIFDRLRQQLVCNELSRIVTDPANIRSLVFFDENGDVNTLKDRANSNRQAYLSSNASQLSPDIVGNARVLNFTNNATWELDPWIEYNASSGNLPNSALERYPWGRVSYGGAIDSVSGGSLNVISDAGSGKYVEYNRDNSISIETTKTVEVKAKFNGGGDSSYIFVSIGDGVKRAFIRMRKDGTLGYNNGTTDITISTGLNVTSDFILKYTFNTDGVKVYFNNVQQGDVIPYSNLRTEATTKTVLSLRAIDDSALDVSIYYINYMLDTNSSLSFTDGAGNDQPFSLVWCGKANTTAQRFLLHKRNPDSTSAEYSLSTNPLAIRMLRSAAYIGRTGVFNPAEGYSTIISTYNGSKTSAGLKLYVNGVRIDDTDSNAGSYPGMTPTNSKVSNNRSDYVGDARYAVIAIIAEELSATQAKQIDAVLRSYCGIDAVTL